MPLRNVAYGSAKHPRKRRLLQYHGFGDGCRAMCDRLAVHDLALSSSFSAVSFQLFLAQLPSNALVGKLVALIALLCLATRSILVGAPFEGE